MSASSPLLVDGGCHAIPFIEVDADGSDFIVNPQAAQFLKALHGPFGVVSICGVYRSGKSFFLNQCLLNRPSVTNLQQGIINKRCSSSGGSSSGSSSSSPPSSSTTTSRSIITTATTTTTTTSTSNCGTTDKSTAAAAAAQLFRVGETVSACTKGIWIYPKLIDGKFIVLDCEGAFSLSADQNHDIRIFTLALLMSSFFIYNSVKSIDSSTLQNLAFTGKLSAMVQQTDKADLPQLLWLIRDFTLELRDQKGNKMSATQYLHFAMNNSSNSSHSEISSSLNSLFSSSDCAVLPPLPSSTVTTTPSSSSYSHSSSSASSASASASVVSFVSVLEEIREQILSQVRPKTCAGRPILGTTFLALVKQYLHTVNAGKIPVIEDSWTMVSKCNEQHVRESLLLQLQHKIQRLPVCADMKFLFRMKRLGYHVEELYDQQVMTPDWRMFLRQKRALFDQSVTSNHVKLLQTITNRIDTLIAQINMDTVIGMVVDKKGVDDDDDDDDYSGGGGDYSGGGGDDDDNNNNKKDSHLKSGNIKKKNNNNDNGDNNNKNKNDDSILLLFENWYNQVEKAIKDIANQFGTTNNGNDQYDHHQYPPPRSSSSCPPYTETDDLSTVGLFYQHFEKSMWFQMKLIVDALHKRFTRSDQNLQKIQKRRLKEQLHYRHECNRFDGERSVLKQKLEQIQTLLKKKQEDFLDEINKCKASFSQEKAQLQEHLQKVQENGEALHEKYIQAQNKLQVTNKELTLSQVNLNDFKNKYESLESTYNDLKTTHDCMLESVNQTGHLEHQVEKWQQKFGQCEELFLEQQNESKALNLQLQTLKSETESSLHQIVLRHKSELTNQHGRMMSVQKKLNQMELLVNQQRTTIKQVRENSESELDATNKKYEAEILHLKQEIRRADQQVDMLKQLLESTRNDHKKYVENRDVEFERRMMTQRKKASDETQALHECLKKNEENRHELNTKLMCQNIKLQYTEKRLAEVTNDHKNKRRKLNYDSLVQESATLRAKEKWQTTQLVEYQKEIMELKKKYQQSITNHQKTKRDLDIKCLKLKLQYEQRLSSNRMNNNNNNNNNNNSNDNILNGPDNNNNNNNNNNNSIRSESVGGPGNSSNNNDGSDINKTNR